MFKLIFKVLIFSQIIINFLYAQKKGCLDRNSINYDSTATINDGTCKYPKTKIRVKKSILLSPQIKETSGLIFFNQLLWTHNDDRDNFIYGIDTASGKIIKSIRLKYLENIDWEEISQDEDFIYIGDIGNNKGNRKDLRIYRIAKNDFIEGNMKIDTIAFKYNLQNEFNSSQANTTNFDCEAFIIVEDSIYLFTKEWSNLNTSIYAIPKLPGNYTAIHRHTIDVKGLITGAVFCKKQKMIALCGYSKLLEPFVYLLKEFNNYNFNATNRRKLELNLPLHQIEGITTYNEKDFFISNEELSRSILEIPTKLHTFSLGGF